MSILINGMEMPKDGEHPVWVALHSDGTVEYYANKGDGWQMTTAVPVPPHTGRLIDADALEKDAQKRLLMCNKNDNQFQRPYEVMRAIALAPTIIPADLAEEGET